MIANHIEAFDDVGTSPHQTCGCDDEVPGYKIREVPTVTSLRDTNFMVEGAFADLT
jgi:hypothetical protein